MNKHRPYTPELERLTHIFELLHSDYEPKKRLWLADICGVHWRTIQRDIEWMKAHGAHMGSDKKRGYYFKDQSWLVPRPPIIMTQELLTSLLIARKAITHYAGTPLEMTLQKLFETLTGKVMADLTFGGAANLSNAVAFSPSRSPEVRPAVWQVIFDGITQRHTVEIKYQSWKDKKPSLRQVNPCHLACLDGVWYLFAAAPNRSDLHQYAIHRISEARLTKLPFPVDLHVNPADTADGSFNRFAATGKTTQLKVRFSKDIANLVIGYHWHPKQITRVLSSGDIQICFPISMAGDREWEYYHVLRWVLSFGKHIEVLKPDELRRDIRNVAKIIFMKHTKNIGRGQNQSNAEE